MTMNTNRIVVISLFFFFFINFTVADQSNLFVTTKHGNVMGVEQRSATGRTYYAFEGIPYAAPPVGDLRFKEPQPVKRWMGNLISNKPSACMQYEHSTFGTQYHVTGSEDCLYLNVYTPALNQQGERRVGNGFDDDSIFDVLVYIHGGCFMFRTSTVYQPINIIDRNLTLVTINYRLGPLGFLNLEHPLMPGNNGLKDQIAALKWIQENIRSFGGNPGSVTISGSSAGGASVHLHYLSPLAKGLFHRGISMSGSALNPWIISKKPKKFGVELAERVGCYRDMSVENVVKCLKQRPAEMIVESVRLFFKFLYNPISPFGPTIDRFSSTPFLMDDPENLMKSGKIQDLPWLVSVTASEGLYPGAEFIQTVKHLQELDKRWTELAPCILNFNLTNESPEIAERIKIEYLRGGAINKENFSKLIQMIGDRLFVSGNVKSARIQSLKNKSPVYFYKYNHRGDKSLSTGLSGTNKDFGASHADDILQVFRFTNRNDKPIRETLMNIYESFSRTGKPDVNGINGNWIPVNARNDLLIYLDIHKTTVSMLSTKDYQFGNLKFWDGLFP